MTVEYTKSHLEQTPALAFVEREVEGILEIVRRGVEEGDEGRGDSKEGTREDGWREGKQEGRREGTSDEREQGRREEVGGK